MATFGYLVLMSIIADTNVLNLMQAETLFKDTVIDLGPDVKRPFL
jgi:hypothetical protein